MEARKKADEKHAGDHCPCNCFGVRVIGCENGGHYIKRTDVKSPPSSSDCKTGNTRTDFSLVTICEAIPDGMRAVSIPVDEVTGVSRRVHRGDRVDVIAVSAVPNEDGGRFPACFFRRWRSFPPGRTKTRPEDRSTATVPVLTSDPISGW